MELHVTSQEAASTLDDLLDRVRAGESVVIERDGQPVVRMVPLTPAGSNLTHEDVAAIQNAIERGRELDDGWADAVDDARRLGNQPPRRKDPWDR
jgi:antitoxin (DNA-binding transcriptional repressor) of toxin-antitoxin stability system